MQLLTQLSAVATEAEFDEPRGILQVAHVEAAPGVHVQIALGSAGLIIRRRDAKVGIPHAELLQLAGRYCQDLQIPPPITPQTPTN